MASSAPVAAGAGSTQLTAIRGVIRELSALAAQKQAIEAAGGDTTAVERQITAFRTVVVGLQAALVPKPANATSSGANLSSPVLVPAPPVSGQPSAAAARFLEAMEELRVAEQQLEYQSQEAAACAPAAIASAGDASGDAAARERQSSAPTGEAAQPAPSAQVAGGSASKDGAPAQRYMWQAPAGFLLPPQLGAPRQAAPPPPPAAPPAPPAPPAVAERAEAAASPPPASNSRAVAAQKARLERQAALLAAQLAAAREESSPRAEPAEPEKAAEAAAASEVTPPASPPAADASATDKVAVLEAEIASLHSEIARLTSCSWLDTAALSAQMTDASALVASVHAWAAQSTQAALEEALASTQRALEAAAVAVPALTSLEAAGSVPSPLDAIANFVAAEFQPFAVAARNAAASAAPPAADEAADADKGATQPEVQHIRSAVLPPAARPPVPQISPPFRSRPVWSEPPPLEAAPAGAVVIPADLLSALPPELSAQLLRAAEEVAKPLADPDAGAVQDFASEMRRQTEERRRKQLAAARAAAAATPPAEELDSMDGGGVL